MRMVWKKLQPDEWISTLSYPLSLDQTLGKLRWNSLRLRVSALEIYFPLAKRAQEGSKSRDGMAFRPYLVTRRFQIILGGSLFLFAAPMARG